MTTAKFWIYLYSMQNKYISLIIAGMLAWCGDPPKTAMQAYQKSAHFQERVAACIKRTGGTAGSCKLEWIAGIREWEKLNKSLNN